MAENNGFTHLPPPTVISRKTEITWWRCSICADKRGILLIELLTVAM